MPKLVSFPSLFDDVPAAAAAVDAGVFAALPEPPRSSPEDELPPDWRERAHALDIRRSWIVEAPAGSGKTGLLIQRLLKLLGDDTVHQPEEVLAITFTRAATEEIRDRVLEQMEAAAAGTPVAGAFERSTRELAEQLLERDRRLGWDLRNYPRRINIRTIDSVCGEIVGALPLLSGGAGQLRPTEDAGSLYREAVRNVLLRLGGADRGLDRALRTLLERRDGSLANCEQLLMEMLGTREQWGDLIPLARPALDDEELDREVLPRLNLALEEVICAELTRLHRALPEPFLRQLTELAAEMSDRPGYRDDPSPIAVCRNRYNTPEARVADLEMWRALLHLLVKPGDKKWRVGFNSNHVGFTMERADRDRLRDLVEQARETPGLLPVIQRASRLPPAEYPDEQWRMVKALFYVLGAAVTELQEVFARHGACDFAEGSIQARSALRDEAGAGDLRSALGFELKHLLVDEMQDTSSGQYELLELLTGHWAADSRTLFLVGDPKQSIYMFRQARVERFLRTMREGRLDALRLHPLRLTANFRSQAGLVADFNGNFHSVFAAADATVDETIPFTAAQATRPARPDAGEQPSLAWHLRRLPPAAAEDAPETGAGADAEARREDARAIRALVERWRARPLPPGRTKPWTIAVLVRARQHLLEVVSALRGTGNDSPIPFRAVKVEQLGERQEILDLLALTRAVLHPADRVAWLSLLRAPWCGLTLQELHLLTGADDPAFEGVLVEQLLEVRGPLLGAESRSRVRRLARILQAAEMQRNEVPLPQLIERTWRSLGGPLALGPDERNNAQRFFVLLDEFEEGVGRIDLARLHAEVKRIYAESSAADDAVDLMTIHQAKGLEWDVVLVPALERDTRQGVSRLLIWEELTGTSAEAAHTLLAPIQGKGQPSEALNQWLNGLAREREAEERKRLFYVACTRAREELHLFGAVETRRTGEICTPCRGSLLAAAWPAAEAFVEAEHARSPEVIEFPSPRPVETLSLAAAAEPPVSAAAVFRLPDGLDPLPGRAASAGEAVAEQAEAARPAAEPPHGSLLLRAFGNTVHAVLERVAEQMAAGKSVEELLAELSSVRDRAAVLLRSAGISPREVSRLAHEAETALANSLSDAAGRWILGPRAGAAAEFSRTVWRDEGPPQTVRVDRLFVAGAEPMSEGADCLWLIDYKTATHGRGNVAEFLAQQRGQYAAQLEGYARVLGGFGGTAETRVGLYFPLLRQLVWWQPPGS